MGVIVKLATWVVLGFASTLLMSIACSSTDDVINPPVADGPCSDTIGNRFVDCGNGTVTDTQTNWIWLTNANCFGLETWDAATASAAGLKNGECGLTDHSSAGDWLLPDLYCPPGNTCAFTSAGGTFATILGSACTTAPYVLDTAGTGCWTEGHAFSGVQSAYYWSLTTNSSFPSSAQSLDLINGFVDTNMKASTFYVWPVRR
jgi:hypothetical protein